MRFESEIFTPNPFPNLRQDGVRKLKSFIVFLHVLEASASNGSKNEKWYLFGLKLWSGLNGPTAPTTQKYHYFFIDAAPNLVVCFS